MKDKEYFYMFSNGSYSDYCVGGMFKSKQPLTKEWFGEYLKNKLIKKFPEGKEYFEQCPADLDYFESGYNVSVKFYEFCTQDLAPDEKSHKNYDKWAAEYNPWARRKDAWLKENNFHTDVTLYAIEDGILESVEYEEIWCGN